MELFTKAKRKLRNKKITMDISDIDTIREKMIALDGSCVLFRKCEVQELWYHFSESRCAGELCINDETLNGFIEWIL